jgi:hypothetical protein
MYHVGLQNQAEFQNVISSFAWKDVRIRLIRID